MSNFFICLQKSAGNPDLNFLRWLVTFLWMNLSDENFLMT